MKIAIPTNDRKTIANRTGRAKEFAVYEIINSEIVNTEYFENKHEHNHGEGEKHKHSHNEIIDILINTDLFLVNIIGKYLKHEVEDANIKYILTKETNIYEALKKYL